MSKKYYFDKSKRVKLDTKKDEETKRFFVSSICLGQMQIDGEEHHHIANVMRLSAGDEITLVCNDDFDYHAKILDVNKKFTLVDVYSKVRNQANPKIELTAFVAVNKNEPMSLMIRMLSEIGISYFVPFTSKWTASQDAHEKIDRYQKIADQSAKQCRRSKTLIVKETQKLDEICKEFHDYDVVFFAYENEDDFCLHDYVKKYENKTKEHKRIAFVIGPVAGFDVQEAEQIKNSGAVSISLGKRILRADTACVSLAYAIMEKFE